MKHFGAQLICACGTVLISDGVNWVCPHEGELVITWEGDVKKLVPHKGTKIHDARLNVGKSVQVVRKPGPVGAPGSRSRIKLRAQVRSGPMKACSICNPLTAANYRAQVARLKGRGWKIKL